MQSIYSLQFDKPNALMASQEFFQIVRAVTELRILECSVNVIGMDDGAGRYNKDLVESLTCLSRTLMCKIESVGSLLLKSM